MNNAPTNEFRPLSAWGYLGYQLLFAIPLLGLIFMIIFALDSSYIARRNFARSFFIVMILIVVIFLLFSAAIMSAFSNMNLPL